MDAPRVSFAMPVYNAEDTIGLVLDSLIAQDFQSWEIVICDNQSTDRTGEVVEAYAGRDARIRWEPNGENLGQIRNFNRTLEHARGEFIRWIGDDDTLEPGYTSSCVEALDAHPEWASVTTHQDFEDEYGNVSSAAYEGERLDSPDPVRRYQRMLFFLSANFRYCDPNYGMIRRDTMLRTGGLPDAYENDQIFASRLILEGPMGHLPELLAHRVRPFHSSLTDRQIAQIMHPLKWRRVLWLRWSLPGLLMLLHLLRSDLTPGQKLRCLPALGRHVARRAFYHTRRRLRPLAQTPGIGVIKRWLKACLAWPRRAADRRASPPRDTRRAAPGRVRPPAPQVPRGGRRRSG